MPWLRITASTRARKIMMGTWMTMKMKLCPSGCLEDVVMSHADEIAQADKGVRRSLPPSLYYVTRRWKGMSNAFIGLGNFVRMAHDKSSRQPWSITSSSWSSRSPS